MMVNIPFWGNSNKGPGMGEKPWGNHFAGLRMVESLKDKAWEL